MGKIKNIAIDLQNKLPPEDRMTTTTDPETET